MKNFFFGGGGGGQIRCIMGDVQVANCSRVRKGVTFGAVRSRSEPKGSGSILLSPILCFIKRCYGKEEFDTDRS